MVYPGKQFLYFENDRLGGIHANRQARDEAHRDSPVLGAALIEDLTGGWSSRLRGKRRRGVRCRVAAPLRRATSPIGCATRQARPPSLAWIVHPFGYSAGPPARDRHRLRRPAISSIIEPCRPWLSWVGKGSSVFSERESLLKCTERFGPNLVAAIRIDFQRPHSMMQCR